MPARFEALNRAKPAIMYEDSTMMEEGFGRWQRELDTLTDRLLRGLGTAEDALSRTAEVHFLLLCNRSFYFFVFHCSGAKREEGRGARRHYFC